MSKADWTFLEHLLEEGQEYSTAIGRVWLTVLFLFRMLVLGTAAESAWDDEQATFVCNTKQPGCPAVCYDRAFPISHFRYFILQVIFVSTPTIFYFGYVAIRGGKIHKNAEAKDEKRAAEGGEGRRTGKLSENNREEKEKERSNGNGTKSIKASPEVPKLKGRLLGVYAFSILLKVLLEAGFIVGLWFLYDGFFIAAKFECTWPPCPHTVDCFVSRPTEKTIFTIYTQVIAAISLVLNLIELLHLLKIALSLRLEKRHQDRLPRLEQVSASQTYGTESHVSPPVRRETASYSAPYDSYADMIVQGNRQPGDAQGDRLPSYANCTSDMRETRSNRCHNTMHLQQTGKNPDSPYKGPQKDYV